MAGERTSTSAQAMAAGSVSQLRRTAGAGGGSCRQRSGCASRSEFLEVGAIQSRRNPAPDFRRASALAALDRARTAGAVRQRLRSEEHTSELQSRLHLVCRLLLEKKKNKHRPYRS